MLLGHVAAEVAGVEQRSVVAERPAVVPAHQVGLMALAVPHDRAGTVRAHVVEPDERAVLVAANEDRPAGQVLGDVVARAAQLVLVGDVHPRRPEDRPTLPLEHGGLGVPAGRKGLHQFHWREPTLRPAKDDRHPRAASA